MQGTKFRGQTSENRIIGMIFQLWQAVDASCTKLDSINLISAQTSYAFDPEGIAFPSFRLGHKISALIY